MYKTSTDYGNKYKSLVNVFYHLKTQYIILYNIILYIIFE